MTMPVTVTREVREEGVRKARWAEARGRHPLALPSSEWDYRREQLPELLKSAGEEPELEVLPTTPFRISGWFSGWKGR